jgi:hypothetical protein
MHSVPEARGRCRLDRGLARTDLLANRRERSIAFPATGRIGDIGSKLRDKLPQPSYLIRSIIDWAMLR